MEKPNHKTDAKPGKIFLIFAGLCLAALPFIIFAAITYESPPIVAAERQTPLIGPQSIDFDQKGNTIFKNFDRISNAYMAATSTGRTLEAYYSLRQYPGSPPYIPHKLVKGDGAQMECLTCHAKGGWSEVLKGNTPVTPHPEQTSCRQCHVTIITNSLFVGTDWMSVIPPRLGRSFLPGAPPPIVHDLQNRGNCIACHVGPGTVSAIRVEHPMRGNCRQCHVPDSFAGVFQRAPSK
ncbi:MAG: cytochrome C [Deltaproteobacteria bacterium]|nr:cytochrome C [Deltaproteobacteria bacterium]